MVKDASDILWELSLITRNERLRTLYLKQRERRINEKKSLGKGTSNLALWK